MDWMILPLRRYVDFGGRSRRREYWLFLLFTIILSVVAGGIDGLFGLGDAALYRGTGSVAASWSTKGPVGDLVSLALLVPSLSVAVRRLHDTDRSGWWMLLVLVPLLGWLALLIFYLQDGTRGANRYGEDPKMRGLSDVFA